jgi:hypothetical protein
MRATFRIDDERLGFNAPEASLTDGRPLGSGDIEAFEAWAATYQSLREKTGAEGQLIDLGRALYRWLDGNERWLDALLAAADPPLIFEFQALGTTGATAKAFLQAPWEVLAEPDGSFVAGDAIRLYCPLRRLGRAVEPAPPGDQLPVYERLGDVRAKAVAMGKIADVLEARGDLDEALRIRRQEQLPVIERLGGRDLVIGRGNLAITLRSQHARRPRGGSAPALPGTRRRAADAVAGSGADRGVPEKPWAELRLSGGRCALTLPSLSRRAPPTPARLRRAGEGIHARRARPSPACGRGWRASASRVRGAGAVTDARRQKDTAGAPPTPR